MWPSAFVHIFSATACILKSKRDFARLSLGRNMQSWQQQRRLWSSLNFPGLFLQIEMLKCLQFLLLKLVCVDGWLRCTSRMVSQRVLCQRDLDLSPQRWGKWVGHCHCTANPRADGAAKAPDATRSVDSKLLQDMLDVIHEKKKGISVAWNKT